MQHRFSESQLASPTAQPVRPVSPQELQTSLYSLSYSPVTLASHHSSPAGLPPAPQLVSYQPTPMSRLHPAFPPAQQRPINVPLSAGQQPVSQPLGQLPPRLAQYYPQYRLPQTPFHPPYNVANSKPHARVSATNSSPNCSGHCRNGYSLSLRHPKAETLCLQLWKTK